MLPVGARLEVFRGWDMDLDSCSSSFFGLEVLEVDRSARRDLFGKSGDVDCSIFSLVVSGTWVVVPWAATVLAETSAGCEEPLERA